ncbi:Gfo/Idh/MocA family oxidoreductase [Botrimarina sp.]|uniref:Gfo/Idh/MocA family protein n=1 Tax=Botrimarina sp. TaxID=2795802 RepID=UPI0032ED6A0C
MKAQLTDLSRRGFLKQSAALAGAAAAPSALAAAPGANDRIGILVVGCGGIARAHAEWMPKSLQIRALCDVDSHRLRSFQAEFALHALVSSDYRELLPRPDIDAVLVCTPDHWHAKVAVDAMRAGKSVYCEKPLTLTIAEGDQLRDSVQATGSVVQVGTQQRSDPNFQTAVALVREGRIGAIRRVTCAIGSGPVGGPFGAARVPDGLDWERWLGQAPEVEYRPERCHGNFRWWYEYAGGKLTDWGAHHVDIGLWALGEEALNGTVQVEPLSVVHTPPLVDGMPANDDCFNTASEFHIRCRLPSGAELDIRDNAPDLGFDNGVMFEGERGRVFVNRGKVTGAAVEELERDPLPEEATAALRHGRPVQPHLEAFYQACHDGKPPVSDVASHVRHLNICHAANVAIRLHKPVEFDALTSRFVDRSIDTRWRSRDPRPGYAIDA